MELQFKKDELEQFQKDLIKRGHRHYMGDFNGSDSYYVKTLHKRVIGEDETRSDLQIFLAGYDFSKYIDVDIRTFNISAYVMVSRNVEERIELLLDNNLIHDLDDLEEKALKFYDFVINEL